MLNSAKEPVGSPDSAAPSNPAKSSRPGRALALLVAATLFMELLDGTIISTAAPTMGRYFGVRSADVGVAITAYLLTVAILIPLSGWLSDRFGARPIFVAAIITFTVASVLCALSTSLPELTVMRVVQGVGGAMMVPVGRLLVLRSTAKSDVIAAIAYLTWPALFAPIVAPVAGGLLTTYASWQWIFLINVPFGIAALILALRLVPKLAQPAPDRLDWVGLLVSAIGLGSLVYGSALLSGSRIRAPEVAVAFSCAVVFLVAAVLHLLRAPRPLLDLRALRITTFRASQFGGSLFRSSVLAVPFLLPLMFQDDFGWDPAKAGSVVIFVFIGNLVIKPATTPLLRHFGFRTVLVVSNAMAGVATAACGLLQHSTPLLVIAIVLVIGGAFRSIGFSAYNTITFADVEDSAMARANTLASTLQQVASGLGIALGALALRLGQVIRGPLGHSGSTHFAFSVAFFAVAALVVPAIVEAWVLPRTAGAVIGGGVRSGGTTIR